MTCSSFYFRAPTWIHNQKHHSLDVTQEASDSPLCKGKCLSLQKRLIDVAKLQYIYTPRWDLKPVSTMTSSHGRCSSTSTVPQFIYRHWRQFCLSKLRDIPVCSFFSFSHPASSYLRHIFHTLVYESKLMAGRVLFQTLKKVTLNRTCSPSAPGGSETPELSWVVHFKSGENKIIQRR